MPYSPFRRFIPRAAALAALSLLPALSRAGSPEAVRTLEVPHRTVSRWQRPRQLRGDVHAQLVESSALIHAGEARETYGVSGRGLTVAVLDTGLRVTHKDFAGRVLPGRNFTADYGGNPVNVNDGDGHGTNVTGIVAAGGDPHTGIAPGAGIIPLKILRNDGNGNFSDIANALQWVLDHRAQYHISAVNLSLGDEANYPDDNQPADAVLTRIQALRDVDVAVCVAAGNSFWESHSHQGMAYPAIFRGTVSVGAVYDADLGPATYARAAIRADVTGPDIFTPYTQRLHESVNAECRTDLFAPGAQLTSAGITDDTSSSTMEGTSQATPIVAGTILLMQEYHLRQTGVLPTVTQLENWMRAGARIIHDGDDEQDNVQNTDLDYPRVDVAGAMQVMVQEIQGGTFSISGTVRSDGAPLSGVVVSAGPRSAVTSAAGTYVIGGLPAGTYNVVPSRPAYGFSPASVPVTLGPDRTGVDLNAIRLGDPPAAPTRLSATAIRRNACTLQWRDRSDDEDGFGVEARVGRSEFTELGSTDPNQRQVRVTGLAGNTTYYFRVRAYNAYGSSSYSNVLKVRTPR